MTTPFRALEPFQARVVDIPYAAFALSCSPDVTDASDSSDVSDGDDLIVE
jgi:hypothetical protein